MKKLTALILTICLVLSLSIYAAAGELDLPENAVTEPTLSEWEMVETPPDGSMSLMWPWVTALLTV